MLDLLGMPRGEEWLVLLVVVLLLFGPTKLPGLVRQLARTKKVWDEEITGRRKALDEQPAEAKQESEQQ
ncbi:twin-arginine translocase TatA/TatE family subunit [Kribbella sp. GL6]|uniref:twin-arginine translocase TatA/TatE family subunit n=1 Tax=Kribbella sp. GL6 TaxID=3419765 RepID=UPI003D094602